MALKKVTELNSDSKIYYISPYLPKTEMYKKHYSPAAQSKVDYIRSILSKYDAITVCVNCSLTVDNSLFLPRKIKDDKGLCQLLLSKSSKQRFLLPFCGAIMLISVFLYILLNVRSKDIVVLYHSVYYDNIIIFLKKIKRFKIIYEVEEIYADVRDHGLGREREIKKCQSAADAYIFPTELLDEIINDSNKKRVIVYGAYNPSGNERKDKGEKTIVVYSGTLMKGKGARQAVECARALDNRFEIRIIGYGNTDEVKAIKEIIAQNTSSCRVIFDGMKNGDDFVHYLLNCDIGLCIQPNDSCFNGTSFPSKILNYFNCGLNVVATEIEALTKSQLANYIFFTNNSSPEEVAKSIQKAANKTINTYNLLRELDSKATIELGDIIEKIRK